MSATTWLWCGRVAIALGIAQAAVFVAFGAASAGTRVLFAVVVVAGAVIARRHPALIGGLLIFFGLIVIPILVWAINFAHGWATEPTSWGFWEYFWLVTIGGVPLLAAGLLLLSARADGVGQDVSNQYRHSALGQDTKSMWPSP
jgi:hypothetical protein